MLFMHIYSNSNSSTVIYTVACTPMENGKIGGVKTLELTDKIWYM